MTDAKSPLGLGRSHPNSLSKAGRRRDKALGGLLFVCLVAWGFGITLPLMTVEKVFIFEDTYSIVSIIAALYAAKEWAVLALVVLFGIAMPVIKFEQLFRVWWRYDVAGDGVDRAFKRIDAISKWSMSDVFIVAILVVIFKTSGALADARVEPGLYVFSAAVVGSMLLAMLLKRAVRIQRTNRAA